MKLGALGFLSSQEVDAKGAINSGLLDQVFALSWVRKYIGLFGGDKDQVTLAGTSAGGGSVLYHILADEGVTKPGFFRYVCDVSLVNRTRSLTLRSAGIRLIPRRLAAVFFRRCHSDTFLPGTGQRDGMWKRHRRLRLSCPSRCPDGPGCQCQDQLCQSAGRAFFHPGDGWGLYQGASRDTDGQEAGQWEAIIRRCTEIPIYQALRLSVMCIPLTFSTE